MTNTVRVTWKTARCIVGKPGLRQLIAGRGPLLVQNTGVKVYRVGRRFALEGQSADGSDIVQTLQSCAHIRQRSHKPVTSKIDWTQPTQLHLRDKPLVTVPREPREAPPATSLTGLNRRSRRWW